MKQLAASLLIMLPFLGQAQDAAFRLGVKLAPNFHWMRSDSKELKGEGSGLGYTFGLAADLPIGDRGNYYVSTGLFLSRMGGRFAADFSREVDGVTTAIRSEHDLRLRYLEIPVSLKLRAVNDKPLTFYGQVGMSTGFNLRARTEFTTRTAVGGTTTTVTDEDNVIDDIALLRLGLVVGAGIEYALQDITLFGGITFNNAFSNVLDKGAKRLVNENSKSRLYASYLEITTGIYF
jgi:hypothetical protein